MRPMPIIPQTPEQAIQRDYLHGLATPPAPDPAVQLAALQAAIRTHRDTVTTAGLLKTAEEDAGHNAPIFQTLTAAHRELWQHIPEATR